MPTDSSLKRISIVWGSQLFFLLMLGGAIHFLLKEGVPQPDMLMPMGLALSGMAGIALIAGLLLRTFHAGTHALPLLMSRDSSLWHSGLEPAQAEMVMAEAVKKYMTATILGCACAEAAALFGFALAMMVKMPIIYLPFAGAAATVMLWQIPNQASLISIARHIAQERSRSD